MGVAKVKLSDMTCTTVFTFYTEWNTPRTGKNHMEYTVEPDKIVTFKLLKHLATPIKVMLLATGLDDSTDFYMNAIL